MTTTAQNKPATKHARKMAREPEGELGVRDMILLTNSHLTMAALAGYGLNVFEQCVIAPSETEKAPTCSR